MKKVLFLGTMLLLLPITVFASSYNFTFDFHVGLQSQLRSMSGSHVSITTTSKANIVTAAPNFSLTLERVRTIFGIKVYDKIGTVSHPRSGTKTTKWTNVGTGNYQFYMSKANDNVRLTGTGKIFN
jgi:hypothetical protein